jgi:hypothetical protein
MLKFIITALIFFQSCLLFAQAPEQRTFSATIIAGLNASQIDGDETAGYRKIGLNIGARADILFAERWQAGFEILFSQQGSQSQLIKGFPRKYYCHLNYIEVPILIHFKDWEITNEKNQTYHRFHFGVGASYNRLMSGRVLNDGILEFEGNELFDLGNYRKNHLMLMADINFYFTRNWGINLRYERAPMNIKTDTYFNPHMIVFRGLFTF